MKSRLRLTLALPAGRAPSKTGRWPMPPSPKHERSLLVDGNRLTLLTEGPERLEALLGLIDGAKPVGAPALLHVSR